MNIPTEIWTVVDTRGNAIVKSSREVAELYARVWDREYPRLAPRQVIRYTVALPVSNTQGSPEDAIPDPAIPPEAP